MKKQVCFAYIKPENSKFIKAQAKKSGNTMSYCLDKMIESARKKKPFKLDMKPAPKYVREAQKWAERNHRAA